MNRRITFFIPCLLLVCSTLLATIKTSYTQLSADTAQLIVTIDAQPENLVYKDTLSFSLDTMHATIASYSAETQTINHFDPTFKETKKAFDAPFSYKINLTIDEQFNPQDARICLHAYRTKQKTMVQEEGILALADQSNQDNENFITPDIATAIDTTQTVTMPQQCLPSVESTTITARISNLIQSTNSIWLQLLLVLLLGLLMSLTPCIYPMIPITAGILQAQGSKSLFNNFLLSLCYTLGIATTFACLGLMAAFAGQAMGSLMAQPLFIIPLVFLLLYLAGSMIGFYEMYIPNFFQPKSHSVKGGSYISIFLFGAISGTVASPCLSPGLVMLLCIVSTMANKILGFMLLFSFGFGLGIPLLIIGTFSSSLSVLPRAGMWMVEVKKLFGFLMIAMCFYFLNNIMPLHILLWAMAATTLICAFYFIYISNHVHNKRWRIFYTLLGIATLAASCAITFKAYMATMHANVCEVTSDTWLTDYQCAVQQAQSQNKKLFIDIGAPFCSICTAIDKTLMADTQVLKALTHTVNVKIDGSDIHNQKIVERYKVLGFPTFLLIDPNTGDQLARWGGELYGTKPQAFIKQFHKQVK